MDTHRQWSTCPFVGMLGTAARRFLFVRRVQPLGGGDCMAHITHRSGLRLGTRVLGVALIGPLLWALALGLLDAPRVLRAAQEQPTNDRRWTMDDGWKLTNQSIVLRPSSFV